MLVDMLEICMFELFGGVHPEVCVSPAIVTVHVEALARIYVVHVIWVLSEHSFCLCVRWLVLRLLVGFVWV